VRSEPGRGTTVTVSVPLDGAADTGPDSPRVSLR